MRHYFIREHVEQGTRDIEHEGTLDIEHVPGEDQLADIFTKPLNKCRLERLSDLLGVR